MRFQHLKAALFRAQNNYTKRLIVHEIMSPLATKFVTSSKLYLKEVLNGIFRA